MQYNNEQEDGCIWTYVEFPTHYVYLKNERRWKKRTYRHVIGRLSNVSPSAGELFYLRVILNQVRGAKSYEDIRIVHGVTYNTFRDACFAYGLLGDDQEFINAIKEASSWMTGNLIRRLFVTMLLSQCLNEVGRVWQACKTYLSQDMLHINRADESLSDVRFSALQKEQATLVEIEKLLQLNGKNFADYPKLEHVDDDNMIDISNLLIIQELNYNQDELRRMSSLVIHDLTDEQKLIYNQVIHHVNNSLGGFFFTYGYGETEKTFLWNAITSKIRSEGEIVLTVASSGIAATQLPSGRTTHSHFAILINTDEFSMCSINHGSPLANLISKTKLIIWDEAPMVNRFCIEAFDRSLRDIMHSNVIFGGKCVVMGGDFRQILPVIPKGSRADVINSTINSSALWDSCKIMHLMKNMRLLTGSSNIEIERLRDFTKWLLDVGNGDIGSTIDGYSEIEIHDELLIPESSYLMQQMVASIYIDLLVNLTNNEYFNDRAILAPRLDSVFAINDYMLSLLPGEQHDYISFDSICKSSTNLDTLEDLYPTEFLNSITTFGMPNHKISLKVGTPIMLIRNIDQAQGLCNGTHLRVIQLSERVIEAITLNGSKPNNKVIIHRTQMNPSNTIYRSGCNEDNFLLLCHLQ